MADQTVKDANKNQTPQARASGPAAAPTNLDGAQTRDIVKQQRDQANVQGVVQQQMFKALFGTGTAPDQSQRRVKLDKAPSRLRSRTGGRDKEEKKKHHHHGHGDQAETSAEVRELMSIRSANRNTQNTAATNRRAAATGVGASSRASMPLDGAQDQGIDAGIGEGISEGIQQGMVGSDNPAEKAATQARFSDGTSNDAQMSGQALDSINLGTANETQKLLDVVGPEAILTFREKLQQVWVSLDESQTNQLDVIARMPATLSGQTAVELLMVESPQGIHFVAFLRNKNDFDVLATFDRRSLMPDSPSRQLLEAGILAYEQVDGVFKEGGQRIEEKVKELAQNRQQNDMVFNELQRMMVQEKRRRRKFRQMIDYLVDKLDDLDLEIDPGEAPFVPTESAEQQQENLGRGQLEVESEHDIPAPDITGEDAFIVDPSSLDEAEPRFTKTRL